MKQAEFNNQSRHQFIDISMELWREYKTPAGTVLIHKPLKLAVSDNGHRVFDENGISHYIDTRHGFFLSWQVTEGQPHFIK